MVSQGSQYYRQHVRQRGELTADAAMGEYRVLVSDDLRTIATNTNPRDVRAAQERIRDVVMDWILRIPFGHIHEVFGVIVLDYLRLQRSEDPQYVPQPVIPPLVPDPPLSEEEREQYDRWIDQMENPHLDDEGEEVRTIVSQTARMQMLRDIFGRRLVPAPPPVDTGVTDAHVFMQTLGIDRGEVIAYLTRRKTYQYLYPKNVADEVFQQAFNMDWSWLRSRTGIDHYIPRGTADYVQVNAQIETPHGRIPTQVISMPIRAAIVASLLRAWTVQLVVPGDRTNQLDLSGQQQLASRLFSRLLAASRTGMSAFPVNARSVQSNWLLCTVINEAVDDELFRSLFAVSQRADQQVYSGTGCPPVPESGIQHDLRLTLRGRQAYRLLRATHLQSTQYDNQGQQRYLTASNDHHYTVTDLPNGAQQRVYVDITPRIVCAGATVQTIAPCFEGPFDAIIVPIRGGANQWDVDRYRLDLARQAWRQRQAPVVILVIENEADAGDALAFLSTGASSLPNGDFRIPETAIVLNTGSRYVATSLRNPARELLSQNLYGPYLVISGGRRPELDHGQVVQQGQGVTSTGVLVGGVTGLLTTAAAVGIGEAIIATTGSTIPEPQRHVISGLVSGGIGVAAGITAGVIASNTASAHQRANQVPGDNRVMLPDHASDFRGERRDALIRDCIRQFGEVPFRFLGTPTEFISWCNGSPVSSMQPPADIRRTEDCRMIERVLSRFQLQRTQYQSLPAEDHTVFVPRFSITYHFSVRDLLDS